MIKINSNRLNVQINEFGGTIDSIKCDGKECQWQGAEDSWTGKDVVIFPFVARLQDGYYLVNGEKYELKTHGLCRYNTLNIESKTENSVVLSYKWNEETIKQYPYKFEFFVEYKLVGNKMSVTYMVKNVDDKPIFFGLGGHPAFALPAERKNGIDDISGNYLEFNKELDLATYTLEETGCFVSGKEKFGKIKRLDLSKDLFKKYNTLMLTGDKFDKVALCKKDGTKIVMELNNIDILALWTKPDLGAYICIEPWTSIPDTCYPNRELCDKPTIKALDIEDKFSYTYSIEIM